MKKCIGLALGLVCLGLSGIAQTTIRGKVLDQKNRGVPLANVYLQDILDGAITNEEGIFNFSTEAKGTMVLILSRMGYEKISIEINLDQLPEELLIKTKKTNLKVSPVVITAGAFEASDEKQGTILKPLDIVTNAGASGDLFGAIQTLPGVSPTANETGIFVRGGGAYETKTIIDGNIVPRPFFSEVPNIPSRGRFDPFLFKGTLFSTGGYSAEYGQALSSILLLNTQDMPERSATSLSLNLAGIEASHTHLWNNQTALLARVGGSYLDPYFDLINNNRSWIKAPRGYDIALGGRHKTKGGIFKTYFQHQKAKLQLELDNLDKLASPNEFKNNNQNTFWNSSYKGLIGTSWSLYAGLAVSRDIDKDQFNQFYIEEDQSWIQSKLTLGRDLGNKAYVKVGGEFQYREDILIKGFDGGTFEIDLNGTFSAVYTEADIKLNKNIALRLGGRAEYAASIERWNIAPRSSLAFKTGKQSQVSFAYGKFYQPPQATYLWEDNSLNFEQATHYMVNYQWMTGDYTLRIEAYQKDYQELVKFDETFNYNNLGAGYARGVDFFWRDQVSIAKLDYWITYSFVDTERDYLDFPSSATPSFVSRHTFNVIANYQITGINTRLGLSYTGASGRTYTNPNVEGFLNARTIPYHNLNFNLSHITNILGNFTVIYASVRNPFGFEQLFGYTYSADGSLRRPINPTSRRAFFLGLFISFNQ